MENSQRKTKRTGRLPDLVGRGDPPSDGQRQASQPSRMICYCEPEDNGNGETIAKIIFLTKEEAIKQMKSHAATRWGHHYTSDDEALFDFITIHWAWTPE
jgi:hypothetical protein